MGKPNTASLNASSKLALRVLPAICFLNVIGGVWVLMGEGLSALAGLGFGGVAATGACVAAVAGAGVTGVFSWLEVAGSGSI